MSWVLPCTNNGIIVSSHIVYYVHTKVLGKVEQWNKVNESRGRSFIAFPQHFYFLAVFTKQAHFVDANQMLEQ